MSTPRLDLIDQLIDHCSTSKDFSFSNLTKCFVPLGCALFNLEVEVPASISPVYELFEAQLKALAEHLNMSMLDARALFYPDLGLNEYLDDVNEDAISMLRDYRTTGEINWDV